MKFKPPWDPPWEDPRPPWNRGRPFDDRHALRCAESLQDDIWDKDTGDVKAPKYAIDAVRPIPCCPGNILKLYGEGFGDDPGSILFPNAIVVEPIYWSDQFITLEVPESAAAGPLSLHIPWKTVVICGESVVLNRSGDPAEFIGGVPTILEFRMAYVSPPTPANGNQVRVALDWQITVPQYTEVSLIARIWTLIDPAQAVLEERRYVPSAGSRSFDMIFDAVSVLSIVIILEARNDLGGHPNPAIGGHLKTGHRS